MKKVVSLKDFEKVKNMSLNDFNRWVITMCNVAYEDGKKDANKNSIEQWQLEIAIKSTEGIGEKRAQAIIDNINKLCM